MKGKEVIIHGDLLAHCKCGHKQECLVEIPGPFTDTEIFCRDCEELLSTISIIHEFEPGITADEFILVKDVSQESGAMIRIKSVRERVQ